MLEIREAIVVEGRYDKIALSSLVDTAIFTTDGFAVFSDPFSAPSFSAIPAMRRKTKAMIFLRVKRLESP